MVTTVETLDDDVLNLQAMYCYCCGQCSPILTAVEDYCSYHEIWMVLNLSVKVACVSVAANPAVAEDGLRIYGEVISCFGLYDNFKYSIAAFKLEVMH
ncbi:hypothetical protein Tco_0871006 [Tanacetum coccineum]